MSESEAISSLIDDGSLVKPWREKLSEKYTKLPGIRVMHDFFFVRDKSKCSMTVRNLCYTGPTHPATMKPKQSSGMVNFHAEENYITTNKTRSLTAAKLNNLQQMYSNFIPTDRWLPFLQKNQE